ncbi:MAG: ASCH domain-containing protein [Bacteroidaceae bacterium]|nr:ASCH domain-containing protein [Bacteroidaceae bacterium]
MYLTIKQTYFDQIIAGTKKEEYREIKETTYKKYLEVNESGCPYAYTSLISDEDFQKYDLQDEIYIYNNGKCPLVPKQSIKYLNLAVGYNKVRDTALVQVTDITFETLKEKNGDEIRFNPDGKPATDGVLTFWVAVFHLGEVVEKNIVSK